MGKTSRGDGDWNDAYTPSHTPAARKTQMLKSTTRTFLTEATRFGWTTFPNNISMRLTYTGFSPDIQSRCPIIPKSPTCDRWRTSLNLEYSMHMRFTSYRRLLREPSRCGVDCSALLNQDDSDFNLLHWVVKRERTKYDFDHRALFPTIEIVAKTSWLWKLKKSALFVSLRQTIKRPT
ncbi:hypothetical protein BD410DRAFT_320538 [Rickenella mellea]|uniref:Uncharacterized protein n=1 Tax=Rickenella mellea TaxID=50990 RepID=A0A4Y7Q0R4_9AGAM|nr:hypothetical protein BD410DRAFT_320538 [Rickenella mellea]